MPCTTTILPTRAVIPGSPALKSSLEAAIPHRIADVEARGGPSPVEIAWVAHYRDGCELAERVRCLLAGEMGSGVARALNDVVRAAAVMAFQAGGVVVAGVRYEVVKRDQGATVETEAQGASAEAKP